MTIFLLNILHFCLVHLLQLQNSLPQTVIFNQQTLHLSFVPVLQVFVFLELTLEFCVLIGVCGLEFRHLVLQKIDLGTVILFQRLNLYELFSDLLLFGVLELPLHVV